MGEEALQEQVETAEEPGFTVFVCGICNGQSPDEQVIAECEQVKPSRQTNLKVGNLMAVHAWIWKGGECVGLQHTPTYWDVFDIFYSQPGQKIADCKAGLPTHTLCIELRRTFEGKVMRMVLTYDQSYSLQRGEWSYLIENGLVPPRQERK